MMSCSCSSFHFLVGEINPFLACVLSNIKNNTDYCILLLRIANLYCSRIGWQQLLDQNWSKSKFLKKWKNQKLKTKILPKPCDVKFDQNFDQKKVLRAKIELPEAKPCSKSWKNMLFEQDPAKPQHQFLIQFWPGDLFLNFDFRAMDHLTSPIDRPRSQLFRTFFLAQFRLL